MALRSENTMAESLQKMLADISTMKVLPDADLEFLIQLETAVLQKLRAPIDQMMNQMNPQGQNPQGVPSVGPLGPMTPGPVQMERVPGLRSEPNMPSPDELRRMMGGARG